MKRVLFVVCAALTAAACGEKADFAGVGDADLIPFVLSNDFETNEQAGWEAYPYTQDIGYDPRTVCSLEPAHNGSKYSLSRIVMPNGAYDLAGGFTRRIDLWTAPESRFDAAFFLMGDRKPDSLEIVLGLFDGRRFTHVIDAPDVNRWLELSIPLDGFRDGNEKLAPGEHVQAVAIQAIYPIVTHLMSYTIFMDDFKFNGLRTRRFIAIDPPSADFEMFGVSILGRHFNEGDTVAVCVKPEGGRKLTAVECDVLGPDGKPVVSDLVLVDDGTGNDTKAGDNVWSGTLHTIAASDPRGQWTLALNGRTGDGPDVRWNIRFIVPSKRLAPGEHPRLFFTREQLDERMAGQEPEALKRILANIKSTRMPSYDIDAINEGTDLPDESLTGGPYTFISSGPWRTPMVSLGRIIEAGAWKYTFNGDEQAGLLAKKALLKLCAFSVWNHPWMETHGRHIYFPVGYTVKQVAIGYDLLYPLMTEKERAAVREGLMNKAFRYFHRDMVELNRMPSNLSNHIAVIVSGLGLAATAVYGDDQSNPYFEPYLSGIMTKMKTFMDNTYMPGGSYGEPASYQEMATRDLVETLFAFERNFGVDYTTTTDVKDFYWYPLYVTDSKGTYQYFGDSGYHYTTNSSPFKWLAYRLGNPYCYGLVKPAWDAGRGSRLDYFWFRDDIEPAYREALPTSMLFGPKGHMVMRSGWDDRGTIVNFKCGPNSNHYHLDQGSFQVMTNGAMLLTDAGHSNSYYGNLYYPCYYTQPVGHNCMLVDKNAESQLICDYGNGIPSLSHYPTITHAFAGDAVSTVTGDLTNAYKYGIGYDRTVVYLKPGVMFLHDRINAPEEHTYSWLFHSRFADGRNAIVLDGNRMTATHTTARMTMDVLTPAVPDSRVITSDSDESFAMLTSEKMKDTDFLAVLVTEAYDTGRTPVARPKAEMLNGAGWVGARVDVQPGSAFGAFSTEGSAVEMDVEGFRVNGSEFAATVTRSGAVNRWYMNGTSAEKSGRTRFVMSADRPLTTAVLYDRSTVSIETECDGPTEMTVSVPGTPRGIVTSGGTAFADWKYDDTTGSLTLLLPEGHTVLAVR